MAKLRITDLHFASAGRSLLCKATRGLLRQEGRARPRLYWSACALGVLDLL